MENHRNSRRVNSVSLARLFAHTLCAVLLLVTPLEGVRSDAHNLRVVEFKHRPMAHDFQLTNLRGELISLGEQRGRFIVLNFWATWCPPCLAELPSFQVLQDRFDTSELAVLAISSDEQGEKAIKPFTQPMNLSYEILLDEDGTISKAYGAHQLPFTFLIGPKGRIRAAVQGARDWGSEPLLNWFSQQVQLP